MLFNSLQFVLFFLFVFAVYWTLPLRFRKPFMLGASLWFYAAWDWRFVGLILLSSGIDFLCGRLMHREARSGIRKAWLLVSLAANLGILGFFKYFHFFIDSFRAVFPSVPEPALQIILPVGISFFTFQSMSYTIDIYRREIVPVGVLDFFLFVSFFPQLEAGPIVRASEFLPQLKALPRLAWDQVGEGVLRFARGFLKKVFLADSLARFADPVFAEPSAHGGLHCLLAAYAFAFQIYWDFSGYTDMARGAAQCFGFRFPENFDIPYLSASPREFWRRWHMTLSSWLRDYLYKSLGGDRSGKARTLRNLFLTMALGGLWHGANWTFVIWGCYHGALLTLQRLLPGRIAWRPVSILLTFHLVCIGWIFFRAADLELALGFFARLFAGGWAWTPSLSPVALGLAAGAAWQILSDTVGRRSASLPAWQGFHALATAAGVALAFVYSTESVPFIYFQF